MNASLSVPIIGISFSPGLESSQPIFWAGSCSSSSSWISLALLIRIDSIGLANIRNRFAVSCTKQALSQARLCPDSITNPGIPQNHTPTNQALSQARLCPGSITNLSIPLSHYSIPLMPISKPYHKPAYARVLLLT
jgi:hypothetical protein